MTNLLKDSSERSIEEDQFAVAYEGKLTLSPEQSVGENEFLEIQCKKFETKVENKSDIISFDIGIKNMCFCILRPTNFLPNVSHYASFSIIDWNIINLMEDPLTFQQTVDPICSICTKKAKFVKLIKESTKIYYCLKHSKCSNYLLPSKQFTKGSLNKLKKNDLILFCHSKLFFIEPTTKKPLENLTKPQLLDAAVEYFKNNCLLQVSRNFPERSVEETLFAVAGEGKSKNSNENNFSTLHPENFIFDSGNSSAKNVNNSSVKSCSNTDLVEIGWNMKRHLDKIPDSVMNNIKYVIIENQISPIANRMKTIQGMLAQYFIMRCDRIIMDSSEQSIEKSLNKIIINFVSSKNKLKGYLPSQTTANGSSSTLRLDESLNSASTSFLQNSFSPTLCPDENVKSINLPSQATANWSSSTLRPEESLKSPKITEKQKYKKNKNDAIIYCNQILDTNENLKKEWGWTMKMTKKDDYADCFLQGYWFMNEINKGGRRPPTKTTKA